MTRYCDDDVLDRRNQHLKKEFVRKKGDGIAKLLGLITATVKLITATFRCRVLAMRRDIPLQGRAVVRSATNALSDLPLQAHSKSNSFLSAG